MLYSPLYFFFPVGGQIGICRRKGIAKQERRKKGYSLVREETSYSLILFAGSKVDIQVDFHHSFNAYKIVMCQHFGPV